MCYCRFATESDCLRVGVNVVLKDLGLVFLICISNVFI